MGGAASLVARGILLSGNRKPGDRLERGPLLSSCGVALTTFRSAAADLGAHKSSAGLRFFDSSVSGKIAFGPGAGLVVGVAIGAESVRALLVDANGWGYYAHESPNLAGQLAAEPQVVIRRAREAAGSVLDAAFSHRALLIDGQLPLLGWSVAWPSAVDRERRPVGRVLSHPAWGSGQPLDQRVQVGFGVPEMPTYAMPDAHAAAIAVAHWETHEPNYKTRSRHPQLTIVLRLAGNVSGAVIVLEPTRRGQEDGRRTASGFTDSVLLGGVDNHAGLVGHVPVSPALINSLNTDEHSGLGPLCFRPCTCVSSSEHSARHLEQYASVLPLTQRLYPGRERSAALRAILDQPNEPRHQRALTDIAAVVGDTLAGPVTVLNPAKIVITGSLALPAVRDGIARGLGTAHPFGSQPAVTALSGWENDFAPAKGAALAVLRNAVHRRLDDLLEGSHATVSAKIQRLWNPLSSNPL